MADENPMYEVMHRLTAEIPELGYSWQQSNFIQNRIEVSLVCNEGCRPSHSTFVDRAKSAADIERQLRHVLHHIPCEHIKVLPPSPALTTTTPIASTRIEWDRKHLGEWVDEPTGEHRPVDLASIKKMTGPGFPRLTTAIDHLVGIAGERATAVRRRLQRRYGTSSLVTIKIEQPSHVAHDELWVSLRCSLCEANCSVLIKPADDWCERTALLVGMFELSQMARGDMHCTHFPPSTEASNARLDAEQYKRDHLAACETIAQMHAAAVGQVRGPIRGVVQDVEDMRTLFDQTVKHFDATKRELERVLHSKQPQLRSERMVLVDIDD
jgi:hypothetical protein